MNCTQMSVFTKSFKITDIAACNQAAHTAPDAQNVDP